MRALFSGLAGAALLCAPALAADMPVKAAPPPVVAPVYKWTGFYLGAQAGYGWTTPSMSASDRAAITATYGSVPKPEGFVGGLYGGYDYEFANRIVIGVGAELNGFGVDAFNDTSGLPPASRLKSTVDWDIALYGRVGYAFNNFLLYVLAGGAWDHNKVSGANGFIGAFSVSNWHNGWTIGAGAEVPIWGRWNGRIEYRYADVGKQTYLNRQIGATGSVLLAGLGYRF